MFNYSGRQAEDAQRAVVDDMVKDFFKKMAEGKAYITCHMLNYPGNSWDKDCYSTSEWIDCFVKTSQR